MLLLLDGKDAALPDWYTSVAMGFKEGKKKTVSFAVVKQDGEKAARRFGLLKDEEVPKAGMLVVALVDGEGAGRYARFAGSELRVGGGAAVRAIKVRLRLRLRPRLRVRIRVRLRVRLRLRLRLRLS